MLVIRIAEADPGKQAERKHWFAAHQAYLRSGVVRIVRSGPLFDGDQQFGALVVAEVDSLDEMERFSAGDPFVVHGIYRGDVRILRWSPTIG